MRRTGVFATEEEVVEMKELLGAAQTTPVIAMSVGHGLHSGGFAGDAWDRLKRRCHELALDHGLPEITGFYGLDLQDGQFVEA